MVMTSINLALFLIIFLIGEFFSFFIFKALVYSLNKEKSFKFDRALVKGIIERLFLFLALIYNLPQALIAFGALKIGTRFIPQDEKKISNDYFFLGNIISLLISVLYYAIWLKLT